ncbi:maleylpyruvate isomerase family mycothiol-dependent enzyme [Jatrophihabitans lederbergiae]|uniref:Maleylpyruvate isomerase family mycothiol-dependent enzyme n=1 Tax=Jatrophihabitans lederbergiae TaxID=3075547 RepID=A0ABU2JE27_9ACTN|nr:maleylpyruvate isomerase family mycothiol-dependent enzyme [Jatrophihabitans sp. DSM 44399]MDT0262729.1 maleylpyruvate isomerase family mycothiol-dependent enzyme [Jatrophihabitans sp. DSM 44399]
MGSVPGAPTLGMPLAGAVSNLDPPDRGGTGRLLLTERECLIPLLRRAPESSFLLPTPCTGWTVRDVLAHCAAALTRVAADDLHDLCPACNSKDVTDRAGRSMAELIDELEAGYADAGPVIAAAEGRLDVIALGEWVHAGDVREALGLAPAYAAAGTEDALALLRTCSSARNTPLLTAELPDRTLEMGRMLPDQVERAYLRTDAETLIRLYTGRPVGAREYELCGAVPADLVIYR